MFSREENEEWHRGGAGDRRREVDLAAKLGWGNIMVGGVFCAGQVENGRVLGEWEE